MREGLTIAGILILLTSVGISPAGGVFTLIAFATSIILAMQTIHQKTRQLVDTLNNMIRKGEIEYDPMLQKRVNRVAISSASYVIGTAIIGFLVWGTYALVGAGAYFLVILTASLVVVSIVGHYIERTLKKFPVPKQLFKQRRLQT